MPTYNYKCRQCENKFSREATLSEKEAGLEVSCPTCSSEDVFQIFDSVGVLGGGSSAGSDCTSSSCPPDRSCCG